MIWTLELSRIGKSASQPATMKDYQQRASSRTTTATCVRTILTIVIDQQIDEGDGADMMEHVQLGHLILFLAHHEYYGFHELRQL